MSENLSIDEILKRAQEVREKSSQTIKKTNPTAYGSDDKTRVINVNVSENTQQSDFEQEKTVVIPKTEKVENDKTISIKKVKSNQDFDDKTTVLPKNSGKTQVISFDSGENENELDRTVIINSKKAVSSSKSSKSFFKSKNSSEKQYGDAPPEIIERPANIKSKSRFDRTLDLNEIPTIVAVDELEHTRVMGYEAQKKAKNETSVNENDDGQLVLQGFEDMNGSCEKIDEELAEKKLFERRKKKIAEFRIDSPNDVIDNSSQNDFSISSEYNTKTGRRKFLEKLFSKKAKLNVRIFMTSICAVTLILMSATQNTAYLPSFLSDEFNYNIVQTVVFSVCLITNITTVFGGIFSVFTKKGVTSALPVSVASLMIFVHTVLTLCYPDFALNSINLLSGAGAVAIFVYLLGLHSRLKRIIRDFEYISSKDEKYVVENIANPVDATIISRGLLYGEPILKTSVKAKNLVAFDEISVADDPSDKIAKTLYPVLMFLSIVLFIGVSFYTEQWQYGFNALVAALTVSSPFFSVGIFESSLKAVSSKTVDKGALVCGYAGAEFVEDANAMIVEGSDLFYRKDCNLFGMRQFNGAKTDEIILQTAAVLINSKTPLASVFDDVIVGKSSILPEVSDIIYEDKMGLSAWIYGKKVLVGNRNMMINHGVSIPRIEFENRYTKKGRQALYLAVAGKLWAMYIFSYKADKDLQRDLSKLEKTGITILARSTDPYINDEYLAEEFELPQGYLKVMNSSSARVYDKYSSLIAEDAPAFVVHDGTIKGFINAMCAADKLHLCKTLSTFFIDFGCCLGFGLVALLSFINGFDRISSISISVFQIVWTIVTYIISKMRSSGV